MDKKNDIETATPPISVVMSKTTTISTIAVQSGRTRIVIALLHCGNFLQLKILEITPELTNLGATLEEALELQRAHNEVLRQLQNKQSPVEELLRQADQLIVTQKPRAEVYAAMAETLGRAWKDINFILELRKQILDLNVQYHTRAQDFFNVINKLEESCKDTLIPVEMEAVKSFLTNLHDLRRNLLENLMAALQTGNALLAKLRELGTEHMIDSRPDELKPSINKAISQVQSWLDLLHIKRQEVEIIFGKRKMQLEQCLALAILAADLRDLEDKVCRCRTILANTDELGDSASCAELLQHEHKKLLPEAQILQERAIKITKATEQLLASGYFASEEATKQSYAILSAASSYLEDVQNRDNLLNRVIQFFRSAQAAENKLDQIEIQLNTSELPRTSPQLAELHAQCAKTIEQVTEGPITEGYSILDTVNRQSGSEGVKKQVEDLENKKISLSALCVAHKEENQRINKALNKFYDQYNLLQIWLTNIAEAFLQGHKHMGNDLDGAKDFIKLHNELLNDLQVKGNEINSLLLSLPPILEYLDDNQRKDVDDKVEELHGKWLDLKTVLENRLDLGKIYLKFHTEASIVDKEVDKLELSLKNEESVEEDVLKELEFKWEQLTPLYQSAKNTGLTFINDARKVVETHLDTNRAISCVETVLERLAGRQLVVNRAWQTFHTNVVEKIEILRRLEENMSESTKTLNWVTKLEAELYPVINTTSLNPKEISIFIENKLKEVLPDIRKAKQEVDQKIQTAELLLSKAISVNENAILVKDKLKDLNKKLQSITDEYQHLLEKLVTYFNHLTDLGNYIEEVDGYLDGFESITDANKIEVLIKQGDIFKPKIQEKINHAQNLCDQLIQTVAKQEPIEAAQNDIEKLTHTLSLQTKKWESNVSPKFQSLRTQREYLRFYDDLNEVNSNIEKLENQLQDLRGRYGTSLGEAQAASAAYANFEHTIQLLEDKIKAIDSFGNILIQQNHPQSSLIQEKLNLLKDRWNTFKKHIQEIRNLINLSIEYFNLVNQANEWFKEASRLLMSIARRTTLVKKPSEAEELLQEINTFLRPGEEAQNKRIQDIIELSHKIYGPELKTQINHVVSENKEIMHSFSAIMEELNLLYNNLTFQEQEKQKLQKEHEEAQAKLAAAKAEAEAAEAAALIAEKERLAAAEAAKLLEIEALEKQKAAELLAEKKRLEAEEEIKKMKEKALEENRLLEIRQKEAELLAEKQRKAVEEEIKLMKEKALTEEINISRVVPIEIVNLGGISQKQEMHVLPQEERPKFTVLLQDAVVEEGSKFTFRCEVTGNPIPNISWYKAGISIQNNPDYQTTFKDGVCTLTIEETFAEDSSKYTCKAENPIGISETTGSLTVKESSDDIRKPPSFSRPLEPAIIAEGSEFNFYCKVEGYPLPNVQWFKNQECIDNSPDYLITYNNGDAILEFKNVGPKDAGIYTCTASNELGTAKSTANLALTPNLSVQKPMFVVPLKNSHVMIGKRCQLDCEVTGIPAPYLTWLHNGNPLEETKDIKLHRQGDKASLVICKASPKDAGTYSVIARNESGETSSLCTVIIEGHLPLESSDSDVASDMERVKPSIQIPLTDVRIGEGNKVTLDCVIVGQPEPEVIWYHNDNPVKESSDVQLLFQGDKCSLIIQEALPEDKGNYKVVAINSAGEASSQCFLNILPNEEKIEHLVEVRQMGHPPKFLTLIGDALVSEGDKVVFEGSVTGEPKPEIKWFFNNSPLDKKDHINFSLADDGLFKLEIESVKSNDKGVYIVKANNQYGEAKCFAQLIVKSKLPDKITPEKAIPPVFQEPLQDRVAFENTSTIFECNVTGNPKPKITWLFNDNVIKEYDWRMYSSGNKNFLSIPNVSKQTEGKFTCVAENDAGKSSSSASLSVQSVLNITLPEDYNAFEQSHLESSCLIKQFVQKESSVSSSSKIVSSSGLIEQPEVKVHSFKEHNERTFKQINQEKPQISESHSVEEYVKMGNDQPVIHNQSNVFKSNLSSQEIKDVPQPLKITIKTRAPKFVTPFVGKIVDQGATVTFEGTLDSLSDSTVVWTKNGVEINSSDKIQISKDLNKITLTILDVNSNDAGRYTCSVANEAGTAISTADLVIRKNVFPPVFGRRLQAQVIKKGDRIVMEVEVTGTPDPTIGWFKDTEPIEKVLTQNYKIKSYGNAHTLIIEKADLSHSGRFMVKATNSGGEAQSIADIAVFEPTPDTMVEVVKTVVFEDVKKQETLNSFSNQLLSSVSSINKPVEFELPKQEPIIPSDQLVKKQETIVNEQHISQEIKSMKLSHQTPDIMTDEYNDSVLRPLIFDKSLRTDQCEISEPVKKEDDKNKAEIDDSDVGIDHSSITKRSSLQYFVKKIKQNEAESVKPIQSYVKHEAHRQIETSLPTVRQRGMSTISLDENIQELIQENNQSSFDTSNFGSQYIKEYELATEIPITKEDQNYDSFKSTSETYSTITSLPKSNDAQLLQMPDVINKIPDQHIQEYASENKSYQQFQSVTSTNKHLDHIMRGTSPRPEALQMEKLWTTRKEMEEPVLFKETSSEIQQIERPKSALDCSTTIEKNVVEKEWTHKYSTLPLVKPVSFTSNKIITDKQPVHLLQHSSLPTHYVANVSHTVENLPEVINKEENIYQQKYFQSENIHKKIESVKWQPTLESLNARPVSVQDITNEFYLEPGSPPILAYAQPPKERRPSYVETVEHQLESKLEKGPAKVPPGGIRTIPPPPIEKSVPPPLPPKKELPLAPPIPAKPRFKEINVEISNLKNVSTIAPEKIKVGPPPTPTKFIKGKFTDSDYESDMESSKIPAKWRPSLSDTEDLSYRKVITPKLPDVTPSAKVEPIPPSKFEEPVPCTWSPRPQINFEKQYSDKQSTKSVSQISQVHVRQVSPPPVKPGSPPLYLEAPKRAEPSKIIQKITDGYMADTDEPRLQHFNNVEIHQEYKIFNKQECKSSTFNQKSVKVAPKVPPKPKPKTSIMDHKELIRTPIITNVSTEKVGEKYEKQYSEKSYISHNEQNTKICKKALPVTNPSKFVKSEFRESDYESDFDKPIPKVWTPSKTPTRPKFEPIDKPKSAVKLEQIIKPEPRPASYSYIPPSSDVILRPGTPPEMAFASGPQKTQYYTSITSTPYHNAVQTETSNVVHFKESSQNCHRTVSMQQSTKVIKFGDKRTESAKITEISPDLPRIKSTCPTVAKPNKFVPREFRESDYESEAENVRIKPKWAPSGSDTEDLHFKSVRPPSVNHRSSSVPPQQRVLTPMEFDTYPPYKPMDVTDGESRQKYSKISSVSLQTRSKSQEPTMRHTSFVQPGPPPEYGYIPSQELKTTATSIASKHMNSMTETFKSKTQKFAKDLMHDVHKKEVPSKQLQNNDAQVYREETRASQHGTKHIDPDTGLIYFKYDFGYEFGIILPGETKPGEIIFPKKTIIEPPKRNRDIEMPVYHETTKSHQQNGQKSPKNLKWEPTSESELSEYETDGSKKRTLKGSQWDYSSCSPVSLSPSLPSTSPAFYNNSAGSDKPKDIGNSASPSTLGNSISRRGQSQLLPPMFITPLRDIAVVSGQNAKFECIVQSEPAPNILWSKNGRIIEDSNDYQLHFRNGVCRLTISRAYPEDAGTYTCTATNNAGTVSTTATLDVPGEKVIPFIK